MRKLNWFLVLLFLPLTVVGQSSEGKEVINLSSQGVFFSIDSLTTSFIDSTHAVTFLEINPNRFKPGMPDWRVPFPKYISFSFRSPKKTTVYLYGEETANTKIYQTTAAGRFLKQINPQDYTSASATVFLLDVYQDSISRFVIHTQMSNENNYGIQFWVVQKS